MKFDFKSIKKSLKKPNMVKEIQETEKAMKYSRQAVEYNKILAEVIYSMIDKLEEHDEDHITFLWKDTPETTTFQELKDDLEKLKIENFI